MQKIKQIAKNILPLPFFEMLRFLKHWSLRLSNYKSYQSFLCNKNGLEIGGPSILFRTSLPIYPIVNSLDGVNFSCQTLWEGALQAGNSFHYWGKKTGTQFISEATRLECIPSNHYDFLLSSNCLEHIANPLKALQEWKRVIKPKGYLLLILPRKESNFDHKRTVTTFEHLCEDYTNNTTEEDLTHLEEILRLHDLSRDLEAGSFEQFKTRSLDNFHNRTLHHHVFDQILMRKVLEYSGFDVILENATKTDFIALGLKKS